MGISVYPLTKNPVQLEKLAGVPEGTIQTLRAVEKQYPILVEVNPGLEADLDEFYEAHSFLDLAQKKMSDFELFGFGKISFGELETILRTEHEADVFVGFSDKSEIIAQILEALQRRGHSVPDADLLVEGVCWS